MAKHSLIILSIIALIVLIMFRPFLPGTYDGLAVTMSFMTQLFSFVGLLLVPIGMLWLRHELIKKRSISRHERMTRRFAVITLFISVLIAVVLTIGAVSHDHLAFGVIFAATCFYLLLRYYFGLRKNTEPENMRVNPVPVYLIAIPLAVALFRFLLITPTAAYSRNYAIKKSDRLIKNIEASYVRTGSYPISLHALHPDHCPGVTGISQYHYEPNGNAYNLYFEQMSDEWDAKEIVMYNKNDEHGFAAHVMDILEYSGEELVLRRGDRYIYKLAAPHWVRIRFE